MAIAATLIVTRLLFIILIFCAMIVLQVFLSRTELRWPGLILPALWLLFSLILVGNIAIVPDAPNTTIALAIVVFLMGNIPTLVLLAVYAICRRGKRRRAVAGMDVEQELEQMKKKDLGD